MVIGMIFIIMLAIHFIEIWLYIDKIFRNENASAPSQAESILISGSIILLYYSY